MMEWKDTTSGPTEPRSWTLRKNPIKIEVHKHVGCSYWFLSCSAASIHCLPLVSAAVEDARVEATQIVAAQMDLLAAYANEMMLFTTESRASSTDHKEKQA